MTYILLLFTDIIGISHRVLFSSLVSCILTVFRFEFEELLGNKVTTTGGYTAAVNPGLRVYVQVCDCVYI